MSGNYRVLDQRVAGGDQLDAHRADVDPGAGGELEVLDHAAVEHDAARRVGRVGELHRVADAVEALAVECRLGQVGTAVVTGHDVRPAYPHLELTGIGHQLELAARHPQADDAGALDPGVHRGSERPG